MAKHVILRTDVEEPGFVEVFSSIEPGHSVDLTPTKTSVIFDTWDNNEGNYQPVALSRTEVIEVMKWLEQWLDSTEA